MTGPDVCDRIADLLPEFLAGRLSEEDDQRVREHLASCADCRNRANAVSLLQQTPIPAPNPDRWDGFVKGVVEAADRKHRREHRVQTVLIVVAAAVLIVVLAYLVAL